jgi:cell division protein FtsB
MRQRPGVWLIAFAVCVALLAVGRVTLSFAVVQKNMDTEALVREQRALRSENARLQEKLAGLMATPRLRELAMERFGLVSAQSVVYLEGGHLAASERSKGSPVVGSYDGSMQNEAGVLAGGRIAAGLIGDGGR